MSEISHAFQTNKLCHILCRLVCFRPECWQLQHSRSSKAQIQLEGDLHMPELGVLHPGLPPLQKFSFLLGQVPAATLLESHVWHRLLSSSFSSLAQMTGTNTFFSCSCPMTLFLARHQPFLPASPPCPWLPGQAPAEPSRGTGAGAGRGASRDKGHLVLRCLRVVCARMGTMCQGWGWLGAPPAPVRVLLHPVIPVPGLCRTPAHLWLAAFTSAVGFVFLRVSYLRCRQHKSARAPEWLESAFPDGDLHSQDLGLRWNLTDSRVNHLRDGDYAI